MTPDPVLLAIAADLLPGADLDAATMASGQFHDVLLLPGVAAVRVARNAEAAAALPVRTALASRLAALDLPFAVPRPLTDVQVRHGRSAVALSWVGGAARLGEFAAPAACTRLRTALSEVDCSALADVLCAPHAYAGGDDWGALMLDRVVPLLPARWQPEAARRFTEALALPPVAPSLVHGDLATHNLHWDERGELVGVLDWDVAAAWDPAVDVACLSVHGWANLAAVDAETRHRAEVWYRTFGLEQVGAALLTGDDAELHRYLHRAVAFLERT